MDYLSYIIWNVNPDLFSGFITIKIYGVLFALGFLISQQVLIWMFKQEAAKDEESQKRAEKDVETLTIYLVVATIIGARLGHILFYEPDKYFADPLSILKIWEGGLASHGATIAILISFWLFVKKHKHWTYLQIADRLVVVIALTGCLIRLGNFFNSEIYGLPTDSDYGVVFTRKAADAFASPKSPVESVQFIKQDSVSGAGYKMKMLLQFERGTDEAAMKSYVISNVPNILSDRYTYISEHVTYDKTTQLDYKIGATNRTAEIQVIGIPRHPTQIYESLTCILLFFALLYLWSQYKADLPQGRIFGIFLIALFGLRIIHESIKENQVAFEDSMTYNMGQILSVPLVILGIYILYRSFGPAGKLPGAGN